jgi:hypothetical protein
MHSMYVFDEIAYVFQFSKVLSNQNSNYFYYY